jgi:CBS domain-containing protein
MQHRSVRVDEVLHGRRLREVKRLMTDAHTGRCSMKVHEIRTAPALTCTPETSAGVAARLMQEADYGTLPVVDAQS